MAVDLDKFPTNETAKRMLSRVSPIYDKSYVGKWIFQVLGQETGIAWDIVKSLRKQIFLEQCTWGIRYWEERFGIIPDESKDLETRRGAVMAKRVYGRPRSPAVMEEILSAFSGREVAVTEHNSEYCFTVAFGEGEHKVGYLDIIDKINVIKPSHLSYSIDAIEKRTLALYAGSSVYEAQTITLNGYDTTFSYRAAGEPSEPEIQS